MTASARAPIRELPPEYVEVRNIVLTENRLLIRLNLLGIIPLVGMLVWMALWWGLVAARGRGLGGDIGVPWWLLVIVIFLVVLPLHELLHGLTIAWLGYKVRYGANLSKGVLYATADNALFRRNGYLAVAVAPFVGITLLTMALMLVAPGALAYYLALGAVLNAGGAIGDLWSMGVLIHYPAQVLVRDEAEGFRIYAPGSSIQKTEPPSAG